MTASALRFPLDLGCIDGWWRDLVRRPSTQCTPGRQFCRRSLDHDATWTTRDADLEGAQLWTPCVFLGALDDANVVEVPALMVALPVLAGAEALAQEAADHAAELGLPTAHYQVASRSSLHLVWRIEPLRRPKKGAPDDHWAAWLGGLRSWRLAMAKLAAAFEPLGAAAFRRPPSFTMMVPLPQQAHVSEYLDDPARIVAAAPDLRPLRMVELSKPLDHLDAQAFEVVEPHARRAPLFMMPSKAWLRSPRFLAALEPKRDGERHMAALTQVVITTWAGWSFAQQLDHLREWSARNVDVAGFPKVRATSDELVDLVTWAQRELVPGGPRRASGEGRRLQHRDDVIRAVLELLQHEEATHHEWVGTVADLAAAATVLSAQRDARHVVTVSPSSLSKLMGELRAHHGVEASRERSGRSWTMRWRLTVPVTAPLAPPAQTQPEALRATLPAEPEDARGAGPSAPLEAPGCVSDVRLQMGIVPPRPAGDGDAQAGGGLNIGIGGGSWGSGGRSPPAHGAAERSSSPGGPGEAGILDFGPDFRPRVLASEPDLARPEGPEGLRPELVDRVRGFCAAGLSLLVLRPRDKVPVVDRWAPAMVRATAASSVLAALEVQPTANLGVVCGRVSGVVVVDLDTPEALAWAREALPATPMRTKTARGEHWVYRLPNGPDGGPALVATRIGVRPGVDVKGEGSYVVAPGSVHPSGASYEAVGEWTSSTIASLPAYDPAWFVERAANDDTGVEALVDDDPFGPPRPDESDEAYGARMMRAISQAARKGNLSKVRDWSAKQRDAAAVPPNSVQRNNGKPTLGALGLTIPQIPDELPGVQEGRTGPGVPETLGPITSGRGGPLVQPEGPSVGGGELAGMGNGERFTE